MTLTAFVAKSAFRNKRRSILTVASIAFSLLLLCIMLCVWRSFYIDKGAPDSALRIMTRHKVSLANFLPIYYRDKIRTIPGVVHVVPMTWFGGTYKDDKPENFFAQFATDPDEYFDVAADKVMPDEQLAAWKRDRAGCVVDVELAKKHHWKIGDHIILQGSIFPTNLDLTLRGIYTIDPPSSNLYFHAKYLEESVDWFKDTAGFYFVRVDTAEHMPIAARAIDDMFHGSPVPTKSESEQAFKLDFINTLGSVKVFILSICGAVVFTTLLVCANTMAMSIRERTREVAVLRTLGFTRESILKLLLSESVVISLIGGLIGIALATAAVLLVSGPGGIGLPVALHMTIYTALFVMAVAFVVGLISGVIPSYRASNLGIVDALRYIG
ncbi:MAG TPA: FtsX-like permease family protein [Terriglobales bacterium]|jgi:putative ABC transport system permease protein|nr:FtsX-like permease family protein [Terriglobales bacterium]